MIKVKKIIYTLGLSAHGAQKQLIRFIFQIYVFIYSHQYVYDV